MLARRAATGSILVLERAGMRLAKAATGAAQGDDPAEGIGWADLVEHRGSTGHDTAPNRPRATPTAARSCRGAATALDVGRVAPNAMRTPISRCVAHHRHQHTEHPTLPGAAAQRDREKEGVRGAVPARLQQCLEGRGMESPTPGSASLRHGGRGNEIPGRALVRMRAYGRDWKKTDWAAGIDNGSCIPKIAVAISGKIPTMVTCCAGRRPESLSIDRPPGQCDVRRLAEQRQPVSRPTIRSEKLRLAAARIPKVEKCQRHHLED